MLKMLASAAPARAHRHSSQAQFMVATLREAVVVVMVLITVIPMASLTTTLRLVPPFLHPLVDMLILHVGQARNLRCTNLLAVLARIVPCTTLESLCIIRLVIVLRVGQGSEW